MYNKKALRISEGFFYWVFLVIQAGVEPTTRSLEGCCSIQLSYWTIPLHIFRKMKV